MTAPKDTINVLAAPMLDPSMGRKEIIMPVGKAIAEIVDAALPGLSIRDKMYVRVMLVDARGSMFIAPEYWSVVRPKEGVRVVIRVLPGRDALRSVLQIVVSLAAIALGQFWAAGLGLTAGTNAFNLVSGLVGLGVSTIGFLQVDSLLPQAG